MGDLREHELPKRYRICCLSCCEHDIKPFGAEKQHYCKDKEGGDDDDKCTSLKKTVGKKDLECKCLVFKLPKKDPPKKREKWQLVEDDAKTAKDDDDYYFDCFCVVDTDAG